MKCMDDRAPVRPPPRRVVQTRGEPPECARFRGMGVDHVGPKRKDLPDNLDERTDIASERNRSAERWNVNGVLRAPVEQSLEAPFPGRRGAEQQTTAAPEPTELTVQQHHVTRRSADVQAGNQAHDPNGSLDGFGA